MPLKKSGESGFESEYGAWSGTNRQGKNEKIAPAYRLIEIIFKRRAEKNNEGALPRCFWRLDKYKHHIKERNIASKLLKKYDIIFITKALSSKKGSNILSLGNKRLIPLIKEEIQKDAKNKKELEKKPVEPVNNKETTKTKKPFGKKNIWSQL